MMPLLQVANKTQFPCLLIVATKMDAKGPIIMDVYTATYLKLTLGFLSHIAGLGIDPRRSRRAIKLIKGW